MTGPETVDVPFANPAALEEPPASLTIMKPTEIIPTSSQMSDIMREERLSELDLESGVASTQTSSDAADFQALLDMENEGMEILGLDSVQAAQTPSSMNLTPKIKDASDPIGRDEDMDRIELVRMKESFLHGRKDPTLSSSPGSCLSPTTRPSSLIPRSKLSSAITNPLENLFATRLPKKPFTPLMTDDSDSRRNSDFQPEYVSFIDGMEGPSQSTQKRSNNISGLLFEDSDSPIHDSFTIQEPLASMSNDTSLVQNPEESNDRENILSQLKPMSSLVGGLQFEDDSDFDSGDEIPRPKRSHPDEVISTQASFAFSGFTESDGEDGEERHEQATPSSKRFRSDHGVWSNSRHSTQSSQMDGSQDDMDFEDSQGSFEMTDTAAVAKFAQSLSKKPSNRLAQDSKKRLFSLETLLERNYTTRPVGDSVHAVNSAGLDLYFPIKKQRSQFSKTSKTNLLGIPIHKMMEEAQKQRTEQLLANEPSSLPDQPSAESLRKSKKSKVPTQLWVNKYTPKRYTDLLGNEAVNRLVLSWVKHWDFCVFKRKIKTSAADRKSRFGRKVNSLEQDSLQRPEKKILLLSGRAGLGKTTLAHIIGKHCGYNTIEINASDDRTADVFRNKLMNAINCANVNSPKPNLVIVDEIDGVSSAGGEGSFIKSLVDLLANDGKFKSQESGKKKKRKGPQRIMRPIICICNDLYSPVLRPLRPFAQVITFPAPPPLQPLAKRLDEICNYEGLRSDMHSLMTLCEATDGDVRSCLNTLQFVLQKQMAAIKSGKSQLIPSLSMEDLRDVGNKDMQKSLFQIWDAIFTVPVSKAKKTATLRQQHQDNAIDRLYSMIYSSGETEKLLQGCFENYLSKRMVDMDGSSTISMGSRTEQALDWFIFYDMLEKRVSYSQEWQLASYLPFSMIVMHRLFASTVPTKIEFPKADYNFYINRKTKEQIVCEMFAGIDPPLKRFWGGFSNASVATSSAASMLSVEMIPYLLRILSPELRGVNLQLMKPHERKQIDRLVAIMVSYGLTFAQSKLGDNQYEYSISPSIEELVSFSNIAEEGRSMAPGVYSTATHHSGKPETKLLPSSYAVRQIIANEVEKERLRRMEAARDLKSKKMNLNKKTSVPSTPKPLAPPRIVKTLEPVVGKLIEATPVKDFFGRVIVIPEPQEAPIEDAKSKKTFVYKYHEGFSNAVRKPLLMRDLIESLF